MPFCVIGSAGTVNTGAVDDLDALADLCDQNELWFHVDGAYGAFGVVDPSRADLFHGMERADSLALDPHKWLSVPFDCGCVLVRDGQTLRDCFSLIPAVIRQVGVGDDDLGAPHEYSFQLSRSFRALKVWVDALACGCEGVPVNSESAERPGGRSRSCRGASWRPRAFGADESFDCMLSLCTYGARGRR